MAYDPLDPDSDCFKPPAVPTEVHCLHCGREYESYLIEWRVETSHNGNKHGFWCCPTPGCGGKGFGFDLLPTDPEFRDENGGWVNFDDDEEGEGDEEGEWSPEDDDELTPEMIDAANEASMKEIPRFDAEKELSEILKDVDENTDAEEEDDEQA